jgi:hypothetical protein
VSALLFSGLVMVYVLGVAGVVAAGSLVGSRPEKPRDLEQRLARVRETASPQDTIIASRPRRPRRRDAFVSQSVAVESLARVFRPVASRRTRIDVATGSSRSARSH